MRRQACKQTADLAVLQKTAQEDPDAGVRDYAAARLRKLLAGTDPMAPAVAERLEYLSNTEDPILAAHLATHAHEPELRRMAISLARDPATLANCALNENIAALRLAAVERLQDKAALERVAQQIGKKDKKVLRTVRDKLKAIATLEAAPQRMRKEAQDLCERAERLGRSGIWNQDKVLSDHLQDQWQKLDTSAVPLESASRFTLAIEAFDQAYATHIAELERRQTLSEERQQRTHECKALLDELETVEADAQAESRLTDILDRWNGLHGPDSGLQKDFKTLFDKLHATIEQQHRLVQRDERLTKHLAKGESLLKRSAPLNHNDLLRWREQGDKLCALQTGDPLSQSFSALVEQIATRMDKQRRHAQQKLEKLPERLALLQQELEEGVLRKATALHQSLHSDLDLIALTGLPHKQYAAAEHDFKQLTPRLRELQKWRKWGTDQHRQEMCERMQALLQAELPLEELHDQLQAMQAEWKQLDHGGSPTNEDLWKQFHRFADQVYARCSPYLEQLAHQREANRQQREALCQQLETFLEHADWSSMDWKRAVRAEREVRTAWGSIGPVDPKQRKGLDKRYHKAMKQLDAQLSGERARNKAFKTTLIENVTRLIDEPDLDTALREVKQLQRQWQTTVACRRKQENQMWRHFREACDQVYERRNAIQHAQRAQLETHAASLASLCEELESAASTGVDNADELLHHLHKLQGRWSESAGLELNRPTQAKLSKRWDNGVNKLQQRISELRHEAEREQLDRLRDLAALCLECEAAAETAPMDETDRDDWRRRFAALPVPEKANWREDIVLRFETALDGSTEGPARQAWLDSLPDNVAHRERLCLQLEVLAGIDSPAEAAQARLAFQVSRLSGHLAEGTDDNLDNALGLELAWYIDGPVPAVKMRQLQARFERALSASVQARNRTEGPVHSGN